MPSGATVFEGQIITTGRDTKALVALADKTRVVFAANSRGRLSERGVVLEDGIARFITAAESGTPIKAQELLLAPATKSMTIEAAILPKKQIKVSSFQGIVNVTDPTGAVLKKVGKGQAFIFALRPPAERSSASIYVAAASAGAAVAAVSLAGISAGALGATAATTYIAIGAAAAGAAAGGSLAAVNRGS